MGTSQFYIENDYGTVFIDETYRNFVFKSKGTQVISDTGSGWNYTTISFSGTNPVLAVRPPEGVTIAVSSINFYNGVWNAELIISYGSGNKTFEYYVFEMIPPAARPFTEGLQLLNDNMEAVFDSSYDYLKVIDILQASARSSLSLGFNAKEAVVFATPTIQQDGGGGGYSQRIEGYVMTNGHLQPQRIYMGYTDTSDNGSGVSEPTYNYDTIELIIDVGGL